MSTDSIIRVHSDTELTFGKKSYKCSVGRGGRRSDKKEGDGATPVGTWPLRSVLFRADRLDRPRTALPTAPIARDAGWCDTPSSPHYNQPIEFPFADSAERLWREDNVYDIIVVLGYNDDPVVPGKGSAIFFHLATPDHTPTEGCVAVSKEDMLDILQACGPEARMEVIS